MPRLFVRHVRRWFDLWLVFLTAALLNAHYVLTTPYNVRTYDIGGHMEYLAHVYGYWTVPLARMGWEMHQPPLYYFLGAAWLHGERWLGVESDHAWINLQLLSLALSVITIAAAMIAAMLLFPRKQEQNKAILFLGIVATLPGIVFISARLSNDALALPLFAAFFASLLWWWKADNDLSWFVCVMLLIAGVLTKFTTLPLVLVFFACLALRKDTKRSRKFFLASGAIFMLIAATGWVFVLRISDGFLHRLAMPGTGGLNGALTLPYSVGDMVSFSPVRILQTAYNDSWHDTFGRRYLWEFLFKSAYVGEWQFPRQLLWLHRSMLAGGLAVLGLSVLGAWRDCKKKGPWRIPLLAVLAAGMASMFVNRLLHSAACSQDFRYVPYLILPIAAYAAMGVDVLPKKFRTIVTGMLVAYVVACTAFILSLSFVF